MGFETEFILLKSTSPIDAVNYHGWSNSPALPSGSVEAKVLHEIAEAIQASGIELQMYHAEAAPGQVCLLSCCNMQDTNGLIVRSRYWTSPSIGSRGCSYSYS